MARSIVKLLIICALCLPLMGQDYGSGIAMVNYQPTGGGAATPLSVLIFGSHFQSILDDTTVYYSIWGTINSATTTESETFQVISTPGNFTDLRVELSSDVGDAGDDAIFTFRVNGNDSSPLMECRIDGETSGSQIECETSVTVHVDAGDLVSLELLTLNTPGFTLPRWTFHFTSDNNDEQNLLGQYDAGHNSGIKHGPVAAAYFLGGQTNAQHVGLLVPISGQVKNLYIEADVCPGTGDTRVYTVFINGSTTSPAITCTLSGLTNCGDGNTLQCSDTSTDAATVSAGDYITVEDNITAGSPVDMKTSVGLTFITGTTNKFLFGTVTVDTPNTAGTEWISVVGESRFDSESNSRITAQRAFTVTNMNALLITAPGGSESWQITLLEGGSDTAAPVQCTITGASQVCGSDWAGTPEAIANNASISMKFDPSAMAPVSTTGVLIGIAGTVP